MSVRIGQEVFRFESFDQWVNKAQSWFPRHGFHKTNLQTEKPVCVDAKGRICRIGLDFMEARDEDAFPVTVHYYRDRRNAMEMQDD